MHASSELIGNGSQLALFKNIYLDQNVNVHHRSCFLKVSTYPSNIYNEGL